MSLTTWFGWKVTNDNGTDLPDIFPLGFKESDFVRIDTVNTYLKILTDVVERTHGINDDLQTSLWDNCVQSESSDGLITRLAKAMAEKKDLFLVYDPATKVLREATAGEKSQITEDYKKQGESKVGVYISFKNYMRTDMVRLYSVLEYCTVASLSKSMNLSKAIQIKMSDLRASVGLGDSTQAIAQAKLVATALGAGKDILIDAKDTIETSKPDLTAINQSMELLNEKRSFYLGMPCSYITGEAPKGLGDSGEGDAKAIERGLKNYYFAIIKPVLESVFQIKTTFKSQDFRQITSALEALKTFSLVDEELISVENKTMIVNKLLDLDENAKGTPTVQAPVLPDNSQKNANNFLGAKP